MPGFSPPFKKLGNKMLRKKKLGRVRRCRERMHERSRLRVLRRIEHEDARKSGAYSLHRGEKSEVGPFSEKWVEKVSDCTHTRTRSAEASSPAGRPPATASLSKTRTWLDRFHIYVTVFRVVRFVCVNRSEEFSLSGIGRVSKRRAGCAFAIGRGLNPLMCQEQLTECSERVYLSYLTIRGVFKT